MGAEVKKVTAIDSFKQAGAYYSRDGLAEAIAKMDSLYKGTPDTSDIPPGYQPVKSDPRPSAPVEESAPVITAERLKRLSTSPGSRLQGPFTSMDDLTAAYGKEAIDRFSPAESSEERRAAEDAAFEEKFKNDPGAAVYTALMLEDHDAIQAIPAEAINANHISHAGLLMEHPEVLDILLGKRPDLVNATANGYPVSDKAPATNNPEIILVFADHGAVFTPEHVLEAVKERHYAALETLLTRQPELANSEVEGVHLMVNIARQGDLKSLRIADRAGGDLFATDSSHRNLCEIASVRANREQQTYSKDHTGREIFKALSVWSQKQAPGGTVAEQASEQLALGLLDSEEQQPTSPVPQLHPFLAAP